MLPPAPTDHASVAPRNIVVIFETTSGTRDAFLKAIAAVIPPSRHAAGNLAFNLFQVKDEPNRFLLFERWASPQHHQRHLGADYSQTFNRALEGLLIADPMKSRWLLAEVDVSAE